MIEWIPIASKVINPIKMIKWVYFKFKNHKAILKIILADYCWELDSKKRYKLIGRIISDKVERKNTEIAIIHTFKNENPYYKVLNSSDYAIKSQILSIQEHRKERSKQLISAIEFLLNNYTIQDMNQAMISNNELIILVDNVINFYSRRKDAHYNNKIDLWLTVNKKIYTSARLSDSEMQDLIKVSGRDTLLNPDDINNFRILNIPKQILMDEIIPEVAIASIWYENSEFKNSLKFWTYGLG